MDPEASNVLWTATKMTGDHTGSVPVKSGTHKFSGADLESARINLDMIGIISSDIDDEGKKAKFFGHLKHADLFDLENHAEASFTARAVENIVHAASGRPNYRVTGDHTIKGITLRTTFDRLFWMDGKTARGADNFTFDRAKHDIKYRSGTFFPEIGDKVISDTISLTFDVSAK